MAAISIEDRIDGIMEFLRRRAQCEFNEQTEIRLRELLDLHLGECYRDGVRDCLYRSVKREPWETEEETEPLFFLAYKEAVRKAPLFVHDAEDVIEPDDEM